jgi:hypothetical protein
MSEEPADSAWTGTYNLTASALIHSTACNGTTMTIHSFLNPHQALAFSLELDHNESKLLRITIFLVLVLASSYMARACHVEIQYSVFDDQ